MEVTAKCDVYSFGVVTLEVIMGHHPGEFISSLSSTSTQNIFLRDLLDKRLSDPTDHVTSEVVLVVMLALACIRSSPRSRPTMRRVSQELSASRLPSSEPLSTLALSQLLDMEI